MAHTDFLPHATICNFLSQQDGSYRTSCIRYSLCTSLQIPQTKQPSLTWLLQNLIFTSQSYTFADSFFKASLSYFYSFSLFIHFPVNPPQHVLLIISLCYTQDFILYYVKLYHHDTLSYFLVPYLYFCPYHLRTSSFTFTIICYHISSFVIFLSLRLHTYFLENPFQLFAFYQSFSCYRLMFEFHRYMMDIKDRIIYSRCETLPSA